MMHDDQVDIDIDIARQMIRDQFPQYRHEDITSVRSSGTVNVIFRIGSKSTARFPLRAMNPTECANMLRSEAAAMVEIGEHCYFRRLNRLGSASQVLTTQCHGRYKLGSKARLPRRTG
ncbi:hypothetical protein [Mesorhizobium sp. M0199]|uniref:hypothetical protein n=1 Tax=Mesorhizobium sp. M0199 TaxID=2956911 RepID=UPI003336A190